MRHRLLLLLFTVWAIVGTIPPVSAQMNVLLVLTDDQRFDTLAKMPTVTDLAAQGVQFTNAYMPTPLCGPSRAGLFSGGYLPQNTLVFDNSALNGGAQAFNDKANLGAMLQGVGYRTMFTGKWINGYEGMGRYVPPGWNRFVGRHSYATSTSWFNFQYTIGASSQASSLGSVVSTQKYTTYYERDQVLTFLDAGQNSSQPFFVVWTPSAPHEQATPAPEDAFAFSSYVYRGRGYSESDLSDKPSWVRFSTDPDGTDEFVRDQLRTLLGVDRSLSAIVDRIAAQGKLSNTLIVFTSDNGYMWGEHGLWGKIKPYEESVRVPLVIVMPGVAPRIDNRLVAPMLDLGPTFFELAGITRKTDGASLVPLLRNPGLAWRSNMYFEYTAAGVYTHAIWAGLRNERWKYTRYWTGDEELYDLVNDPYELTNRNRDPALATLKASLWSQTRQRIGLAVMPVRSFPKATVGTSYQYQFSTWGGVAPFAWTLISGKLPPGLTLDASSGSLHGIPTASGTYTFAIRVTDSLIATQAKRPRTFASKPMKLTVAFPPA